MRIGHSRRIARQTCGPDGRHVLEYVFETGFEHKRRTHNWLAVVLEIQVDRARAVFTSDPWIRADGFHPSFEVLTIGHGPGDGRDRPVWTAAVEDLRAWPTSLVDQILKRLKDRPAERTWEVLPHCVLGYERGPRDAAAEPAMLNDLTSLIEIITTAAAAQNR